MLLFCKGFLVLMGCEFFCIVFFFGIFASIFSCVVTTFPIYLGHGCCAWHPGFDNTIVSLLELEFTWPLVGFMPSIGLMHVRPSPMGSIF